VTIPKLRHTLIGKALGALLGVFAVCCSVVALAISFEREAGADALWTLVVGLSGFAAAGLLAGPFLVRLARDLRRMERRAGEISAGNYGEAPSLARKDEVGELGRALNRMAATLAEREEQLESSRNHLFESGKMIALGTFAAGIAHELGNPIHAMSALVERIDASRAGEPSERKMAENLDRMKMISDQIDRLNRVIREVGEFARGGTAQMEATDINQAIASAIRMSRFHHGFRQIELVSNLSRDLPMVQAVPEHLTELALNILINAADAVEPGDGKITVSTRREEGNALISIADNGHGMSKEAAEAAPDLFFTTKSKGSGSGLGLAMCRSIIDEHSGRLEIESAPGRGTTVHVRIPLAVEGKIQ
jgi:signal transduction histidine kinase